MGTENTPTIVTAIVGLLGLFFGVGFWGIMKSLVGNQTQEINNLRKRLRELSDRLDEMEREKYNLANKLDNALDQLDNQVATSQLFQQQNDRLSRENRQLRCQLRNQKGE